MVLDKMKITKRQLRRIIKEEKLKVIKEQSTIAKEADLLTDLTRTADAIQEIADGLYGLQDPGDPGMQVGDEMGESLGLQVERLNGLFDRLEAYFEQADIKNKIPHLGATQVDSQGRAVYAKG